MLLPKKHLQVTWIHSAMENPSKMNTGHLFIYLSLINACNGGSEEPQDNHSHIWQNASRRHSQTHRSIKYAGDPWKRQLNLTHTHITGESSNTEDQRNSSYTNPTHRSAALNRLPVLDLPYWYCPLCSNWRDCSHLKLYCTHYSTRCCANFFDQWWIDYRL